jgi:sporulation protein YlmC with PRC-barrel domain
MKNVIFTVGVAGLLALPIAAQDKTAPKAETPHQSAKISVPESASAKPRLNFFNKASSFLGAPVKNAEGKDIGKVQDLVFDLEKGRLGYIVLSMGEGRSVSVPVTALKPVEGQSHLLLNMTESVLAAAESLQEGDWPATDIFAVGGPAESESGSASSTDTSRKAD